MNIASQPELVERLAAAYALGTLRAGARRRFESLCRQHPSMRAATLVWTSRMSGLTEIQAQHEPPAAVWTRIHNLVQADTEQTRRAQWQAKQHPNRITGAGTLGWFSLKPDWAWRSGALVSLALAAVMGYSLKQQSMHNAEQMMALQQQLDVQAHTQVVAVLADAQAQAQLLVAYSANEQTLVVQRIGGYRTAADRDLQLWALPPGQPPASLGVLTHEAKVRLPLHDLPLSGMPALAVSLEPLGGAPKGSGPTGPVLFQGALLPRPVGV